MFSILDGRKHFYQWDLDRKLIVADKSIEEVHFSNRREGDALVCETYLDGEVLLVDVPNILLQDNWRIFVYAYDENYTKHECEIEVYRRSKPADYIYTETEVKNYDDLLERVEQIEENGISDEAVESAVEKYLEENDIKVDLTGYATEEYVREQIDNIDIPEVDLSDYAKKSEIPSTTGLATEEFVKEEIEKIPEPVDEVHVGASAPTDANVKIWVDTDAESPVATKEYVQQKIAEAQLGAGDGEVDVDLSNYYTKAEADKAIEDAVGAIEIPEVDLSDYAKKDEIPSTEGLATEQYVQDEIAKIEIPEQSNVDLSNYYTKSEVDELIPDEVDIDLSDYYTKSEVDEKIAAIEVPSNETVLIDRGYACSGEYLYFNVTSDEKAKFDALVGGETAVVTLIVNGVTETAEGVVTVPSLGGFKFPTPSNCDSIEYWGGQLEIVAEPNYGTVKIVIKSAEVTVDLSNYYTKTEIDNAGYQNATQVQSAISTALSAIGVAEEGAY